MRLQLVIPVLAAGGTTIVTNFFVLIYYLPNYGAANYHLILGHCFRDLVKNKEDYVVQYVLCSRPTRVKQLMSLLCCFYSFSLSFKTTIERFQAHDQTPSKCGFEKSG